VIIYPNADAMKAMQAEAGKSFTDEEIRKIVRAEIQKSTAGSAVYKIPQGFEVFKEELPKTSSSKVQALPIRRGEEVASARPLARPCAKACSRPSSVADM